MKLSLKDLIAAICIVVTALAVLYGFSDRIDINLTDDTGYLNLGFMIREIFAAGFGPLYSVQFKIVKIFTNDAVAVYDTVMQMMYIIPPLAAFFMIRSLGLNVAAALLISIGFLLSPNILSFITWSKISHYTIIWIMLWVVAAQRVKSTFNLLFTLTVFTFFLGYIRPESHLSWYISSFIFMFYWWRLPDKANREYLRKIIPVFGLLLIFILLNLSSSYTLLSKINLIFNPMAGGRSNIAFAQQFAYNYCEWHGLNNYDWIQWKDIAKENFGDFQTLGEAFKNNPELFVRHIGYNIQQYVSKFIYGVQSIFFPPSVFKWPPIISFLFFAGIILVKILYTGAHSWWLQFKAILSSRKWIVAGLIIIVMPSVISSVIFYSREHYLLLAMPLVLVILTCIFLPQRAEKDFRPRIFNTLIFATAILLIFVFKPSLSDYRTYNVWEEYTYPSNRKMIEAVRTMNFTQKINAVNHEVGFDVYTGKNFKAVNVIAKDSMPYEEWEKIFQPNLYYVTQALLSNKTLANDAYFMDIIQNPERHQLHRINLQKENKGYLLVHDSLKYTPIIF